MIKNKLIKIYDLYKKRIGENFESKKFTVFYNAFYDLLNKILIGNASEEEIHKFSEKAAGEIIGGHFKALG